MSAPSASRVLGEFVAGATPDTLTPALALEAGRSLVNLFAASLATRKHPDVARMLAVLDELSGPRSAGVIGHGLRLDPLSAACINAMSGNLLDFDDTHLATVIHPTAPVAPAVLAVAEQRHLPGRDALLAFVLGAEVECRIGLSVSPAHYRRGWHITATTGVFGAAAGVARLLGLSGDRTAHALGIAASLSGSVVQNLPTAGKNAGVGNAARNGILAALLAQRGCEADAGAIEGPLGWARAMGDTPDLAAMLDALGDRWEFAGNTYKPYPCGIVMHAIIDATLALRDAHALSAEDIAEIEVSGDALLLARGDRSVRTAGDARVSLQHCAAVALVRGRAGTAEFSEAGVQDPLIAALRARTRAKEDPALPTGAATVRLRRSSGEMLEHTVLHARGSLQNPLSDDDLDDKLRTLADEGAWTGDRDALIQALRGLAYSDDVAGVMALAAGSA
jgi:2-methylcitrate dehydratase PrpD